VLSITRWSDWIGIFWFANAGFWKFELDL